MERETKRKAAAAASPDDARATKRQKMPHDEDAPETPDTTFDVGMRFLETMKTAKDKTGRPIATSFLELPDKDAIPHYYEEILLPVSLSTIEAKLKNKEYENLSAVESDVKRMVNNAKQFNDKHSAIYADAERVRKTASNYMVKHNPAYRSGNYTAIATPLPAEKQANGVQATGTVERPRRAAAPVQTPQTPQPDSTPIPTRTRNKSAVGESVARDPIPPADGTERDVTGRTFQEAQEILIEDFEKYVEPESGLKIYQPFATLPSRALKDYYAAIKHPVSLGGVLKKCQGFIGKKEGFSGVSDFKSWRALEDEVSYIWNNARSFNEDGSDLYNLANEFEEHFKRRLEEVKEKVEEPPQPKLKLNMSSTTTKPSGIKLRLGGSKNSPAPGSAPSTPARGSSSTPGVIVDNEALERQKNHVQAGMNGHRPPSSGGIRSGSIPAQQTAGSPSANLNGVKSEGPGVQSPALNSIRLSSTAPEVKGQAPQLPSSAMMPPPNVTPRIASGSPHTTNGYPAPNTMNNMHNNNNAAHPPNGSIFSKHRAPGTTRSDYLLPSLTISSHPSLPLPAPYRLTIPASPHTTHQSVTIALPASHASIQIIPRIPVALTAKPYRIFVTANHSRLAEVVAPGGVPERREKGKPVFEARFGQGVNRVDVEIVAGVGKGNAEGVAREACTVFVHVLRS
ncbi:Bromodomain-containing protein [Saccharata proteae CBS 121410]|uniref:Bromodomain-containing protein n=1 Tax=Saccharata proteae CBS 121410 TaxID=1314787 RepID=A0A9P4HPR7_9PEZI|nr:Bromodomain-containing protein [Saccharata proteae CBS 121410]